MITKVLFYTYTYIIRMHNIHMSIIHLRSECIRLSSTRSDWSSVLTGERTDERSGLQCKMEPEALFIATLVSYFSLNEYSFLIRSHYVQHVKRNP